MESLSAPVAIFVLNALWQAPLVLVAALAAERLLRRAGAAARHGLLAGALLLAVLLPAASVLPRAIAAPAAKAVSTDASAGDASPWMWSGQRLPAPPELPPIDGRVVNAVAAAYALWVGAWCVSLVRALARTRAIRSSARPVLDPDLGRVAARCARALRVREVPVLASQEVSTPATLGAFRPAVVLPDGLAATHPRAVEAALAHELAHVRRRDYALNLVGELLFIPVSFHPAARVLRRRAAAARELACDELVTERLIGRSDYARSLVAIACATSPTARLGHSLGAAGAGDLEERVKNLLSPTPRLGRGRLAASLAAVIVLLAVTTAAASVYAIRAGEEPVAAADTWIAGTWLVNASRPGDKDDDPKAEEMLRPVLTLRIDGGVLSGTVVFPAVKKTEDGPREVARPEVRVVDPKFDGKTFTFRVHNGEEYLEGVLLRSGDALTGTWVSSKSGRNGTLSMVRTK